ncbi:MAG TPA: PrsW family glutamic-type intramembrane protease [Geminicoccus sp.]|uniref:PrsW family glutamic-type intramembrane protease n=1 Tax=Geminicoccus sp. TaxID=2024832 RepID=UPI002E37325B|nr:PrsW family glutamic-type intramembrane protease [Geminicoccus sp.]HEX2529075.1 PrsW family glutamic-type intramembrane protease [Geminicoccus sp.]
MTVLWLLTAMAIPVPFVMLVVARDTTPPTPGFVGSAIGAGLVLGPILAPFAVVAPFADRLGPEGATLANAWLESGFLEEFAKAAALWLLLVPHGLGATSHARATGAVLVSLGFGAYENLLYLADAADPAGLVLMRSLISLPAHLMAGMAAAIVLLVRPRIGATTATLAFAAAWFSHGTFNQWALGWAAALAGEANPEQPPYLAIVLLTAAPLAASAVIGEAWRCLLPRVRGGRWSVLPWALLTAMLVVIAMLFMDGILARWADRPAMLTMALPFAGLPLLLARLTGTLACDAWRARGALAQVRR